MSQYFPGTEGITPKNVESNLEAVNSRIAEIKGEKKPVIKEEPKVEDEELLDIPTTLKLGKKEREVIIHSFEITKIDIPIIHFKISCGKGTYIRSLAHDFGLALNSGAHLSKLCRTKIGSYDLENAYELQEIERKFK